MQSIACGTELGVSPLKGWPYTGFATGWYQIGYSTELSPGDIKPAKWLGEELVVFRTEAGELALLDAFCPHMGAHLGFPGEFGGRVCGEAIQCPWHGWTWDAQGENVAIPYADTTVKATIRKHHVREIDGCILMWYAADGSGPTYEWEGLPYIGDADGYYPISATVDGPHRVKPQFPFENSADPHHFPHVHGSGLDAEFGDYVVDGPRCGNSMKLVFGAGKDRTWLTPNGPVEGTVDNFFWGASLGIARFQIDDMVCIHLTNVTPIDEQQSIFFSTVTATREPGHAGDEPKGRSGRMMETQHWQIRNDFHIWQNMTYRPRPIYMGKAEQTRYAFIRRHFDQFYPNSAYDAAERD